PAVRAGGRGGDAVGVRRDRVVGGASAVVADGGGGDGFGSGEGWVACCGGFLGFVFAWAPVLGSVLASAQSSFQRWLCFQRWPCFRRRLCFPRWPCFRRQPCPQPLPITCPCLLPRSSRAPRLAPS